MENHIIIAILTLILGGALWVVLRSKKTGKKCIGCPDCTTCSGNCGGCK